MLLFWEILMTWKLFKTLGSDKIKIVDTQWDMTLKMKGMLFALPSNIGLDQMKGGWVIHLQADEVIHEQDLNTLRNAIVKYQDDFKIEELLFTLSEFQKATISTFIRVEKPIDLKS